MSEPEWHQVFVGLGGNVGDVRAAFCKALDQLELHPDIRVLSISSLYKTPPWGDEDQDWFLNACAGLETTLDPLALLDVLKSLEKEMKREKTRRWGPRNIDLDILTYGDVCFRSERLEIPHPRMLDRAFVLKPLADIAPQILLSGKSVSDRLQLMNAHEIQIEVKGNAWWRA